MVPNSSELVIEQVNPLEMDKLRIATVDAQGEVRYAFLDEDTYLWVMDYNQPHQKLDRGVTPAFRMFGQRVVWIDNRQFLRGIDLPYAQIAANLPEGDQVKTLPLSENVNVIAFRLMYKRISVLAQTAEGEHRLYTQEADRIANFSQAGWDRIHP